MQAQQMGKTKIEKFKGGGSYRATISKPNVDQKK